MRSFVNVPLTAAKRETLIRVSARERRHPREQAAYLLERALEAEERRQERVCQEVADGSTR